MSEKPLAVIIEKDVARQKYHNYWADGRGGRQGTYLLETPLGRKREVEGVLVEKPFLGRATEEYFYLELTDHCNFSCSHCGVRGDTKFTNEVTGDFPYMTDAFIDAISRELPDTLRRLARDIYFGGGEPLINPQRFAEITQKLDKIPNNYKVLITNGYPLPLEREAFHDFVSPFAIDMMIFSCSEAHEQQYRQKAGKSPFVPDVEPEEALAEKARLVKEYCSEIGLNFLVNTITRKNGSDLRSRILKRAQDIKIFPTTVDGTQEMCSQGQELSIRSNGDAHPHCYDIFRNEKKVGVVGLLTEVIK